MEPSFQTVSEFVTGVKWLLESKFKQVAIRGEISNFRPSMSGHIYFTLSDKNSSVSMVLFKGDLFRNPDAKNLRDGDEVTCFGNVSVYEKRGSFQVVVKQIQKFGQGNLAAEFEKLKARLSSEGLFDLSSKRKIPEMPSRIAIITSKTGAAVKDFYSVYSRRSFHMNLLLIPAVVQGDKAAQSLRRALFFAQKFHREKNHLDAIVLMRGGGSIEDLWCFNDEGLAYDIFNCEVPTISAVGHERDFTISDFVCDFRSETPSAAAEYLSNHQAKIQSTLKNYHNILNLHSRNVLNHSLEKLNKNNPKLFLLKLIESLQDKIRRVGEIDLAGAIDLNKYNLYLDELLNQMNQSMNQKLLEFEHQIEKSNQLLNALGPYQVLKRGYAILEVSDNVIMSKKQLDELPAEQSIDIIFNDGKSVLRK